MVIWLLPGIIALAIIKQLCMVILMNLRLGNISGLNLASYRRMESVENQYVHGRRQGLVLTCSR